MKTIDRVSSPVGNRPNDLNDLLERQRREQLEQARKDIKQAFQAGLFMSGLNSIVLLVVMTQPAVAQKLGGNGWLLYAIEVFVICGCTYGIYRNKKLAAQGMLGYYVINVLLKIFTNSFNLAFTPLTGFFIYCFYRGVVGTSTLQTLSQSFDLYTEGYSISNPPGVAERSPNPIENGELSAPETTSGPPKQQPVKFSIDDRLIELCGGDRSQAEWLLHQIIRKNPTQTMEWCNQEAIIKQFEKNQS